LILDFYVKNQAHNIAGNPAFGEKGKVVETLEFQRLSLLFPLIWWR